MQTIHFLPEEDIAGHVTSERCVCSPELTEGGSYTHRRSARFGWIYPCCGKPGEGLVYVGQGGVDTASDDMGAYIDALPHDCE